MIFSVPKPWAVNSQALESAVAKEEEKGKQAVAEEQKKVRDLESQLRSMTEVSGTHGRHSGTARAWNKSPRKRSVAWCCVWSGVISGLGRGGYGVCFPLNTHRCVSAGRKVDSCKLVDFSNNANFLM